VAHAQHRVRRLHKRSVLMAGKFWTGPIEDQRQADLIIGWAAWPVLAMQVAGLARNFSHITPENLAQALTITLVSGVIWALPAYLLLTKKRVGPAVWLFCCMALIVLVMVIGFGVILFGGGDDGEPLWVILLIAPMVALSVVYCYVLWRAIRATRAFRRWSAAPQSAGQEGDGLPPVA
jgi:hypothetical protein